MLATSPTDIAAHLARFNALHLRLQTMPPEQFFSFPGVIGVRGVADAAETIPSAATNRILLGHGPDVSEARIKEVLGQYARAGIPSLFAWLMPGAHAAEIQSRLAPYHPAAWTHTTYPVVVRDLTEPVETPPLPEGLAVETVSARNYLRLRNALRELYATPRQQRLLARAFGLPGFQLFVVTDHGVPIAATQLWVDTGWAYLGYAVTRESHQGRGAHSALIAVRLAAARQLHCSHALADTLTTTPSTLRNLERAGFHRAFEKTVLRIRTSE